MIDLQKGAKIDLSKEHPNLNQLKIGLKWGANQYDGPEADLDVTAFMLDENENVTAVDRIIGYMSSDGHDLADSVQYAGDNREGSSGNDFDEVITVVLDRIPEDVDKISIVASIYEAEQRKQNFGMISNSVIIGINADTEECIFKYDLGEDYSCETALVCAEVYRYNGSWKFNAVGAGYEGGLANICQRYGIETENG